MLDPKLLELIREMRAGLDNVTKGQWTLVDNEILVEDRYTLCDFDGSVLSGDEDEANSRHLVRCSPENIAKLLDAAESALQQPGGWQDEPHRQRFKSGVRAAIAWLHHRATYEMNDPHAKAILNTAAYNLGNDLAQNQLKPATPPHSGSSGQTGKGK